VEINVPRPGLLHQLKTQFPSHHVIASCQTNASETNKTRPAWTLTIGTFLFIQHQQADLIELVCRQENPFDHAEL
jgi:hypothetical protein